MITKRNAGKAGKVGKCGNQTAEYASKINSNTSIRLVWSMRGLPNTLKQNVLDSKLGTLLHMQSKRLLFHASTTLILISRCTSVLPIIKELDVELIVIDFQIANQL